MYRERSFSNTMYHTKQGQAESNRQYRSQSPVPYRLAIALNLFIQNIHDFYGFVVIL